MMEKKLPFLGGILIKKGFVSHDELVNALKIQQNSKEFLGRILVNQGLINEKQLSESLAEQFGLPLVSVKDREIDWELVDIFSKSLILEHRCFPVERKQDTITMAVENPLDAWIISEAEKQAQEYNVVRAVAPKDEMDIVLEKYNQHMKQKIRKLFGGF